MQDRQSADVCRSGLRKVPGTGLAGRTVAVTGYYDGREDSQHAIVGVDGGDVAELWWRSAQGVHQDALARFGDRVVSTGGYYNSAEDTQHVLAGLDNGDVVELWWWSGQGVNQGTLTYVNPHL